MDYFKFFIEDNKSGHKTKSSYINKNYPGIYASVENFCDNSELKSLSFKQKIWHFINNIDHIPVCAECGNKLRFKRSLKEGYGKYCSIACTNKNTEHKEKSNNTKIKKYGSLNNNVNVNENVKNSYGVDNIMMDNDTVNRILSKNKKDFIERANKKFKNKYDYSEIDYRGMNEKIKINCPDHGPFWVTPRGHLYSSKGCKTCNNVVINSENFVNRSEEVHHKKYDYSFSEYKNYGSKVKIICPEHGEFYQTPKNHIKGNGCYKCSLRETENEKEVKDYIKTIYGGNIIENDRGLLNGKELDILIPDKNVAIEFNGLYWHSEIFKNKNYHIDKTNECNKKGVTLIHIFEDEWENKKDIVKSMIKHKIGATSRKIYGRDCKIQEINTKEAKDFLENNHIQGYVGSYIKLGLFYYGELVSVMTLGKLRKPMNMENAYGCYEMLRFSNKRHTSVMGSANKLFKYFINNYSPYKVVSYADVRYSEGGLYQKLGFRYCHLSAPNYFYIKNKSRNHRFNFRKDKLVSEGYDPTKTEHEIMMERGIYRIYDCGNMKFEFEMN